MVYTVRERCGKQLAHEAAVRADLVSTVPESATPAALGYAKEVRHHSLSGNETQDFCCCLCSVWGAQKHSSGQLLSSCHSNEAKRSFQIKI